MTDIVSHVAETHVNNTLNMSAELPHFSVLRTPVVGPDRRARSSSETKRELRRALVAPALAQQSQLY